MALVQYVSPNLLINDVLSLQNDDLLHTHSTGEGELLFFAGVWGYVVRITSVLPGFFAMLRI